MKNFLTLFFAAMIVSGTAYAQALSKGAVQRLDLDSITLDGTTVTSTGAELNILDGVTSTATELNALDGVTATAAEINYNDIATLGTGAASKSLVLDASGDYTFPSTATIVYGSGGSWTVNSGATANVAGTFQLGGTAVTASAAELNQAADISVNSELVTTANTLTTAECGETLYIDSTTGFAHTLPTPTQGCKFEFVIKTDSTGANHTIVTTGAETIIGRNFDQSGGASTGSSAADTITFNSANALAGDSVLMRSDGTSWHSIAFTSNSAGVAYSSAI